MRRSIIRALNSRLASGLLFAAGTLGFVAGAGAAEPKLALPNPPNVVENADSAVQVHFSVPALSQIPYISRLFKNVGVPADGPNFERIGVDFDFAVDADAEGTMTVCPTEAPLFFGALPHCQAQPAQCQFGPMVFSCQVPGAAAACATSCCDATACGTAQNKWSGPNCASKTGVAVTGPQVNSFVAHCSAAECLHALNREDSTFVQIAVLESRTEMMEEIIPLIIEKAKLEAKVELMAEREKMHKEFVELATTNAHLQARLEFQKEQMAMLQQTIKLAHENESLKQRIAQLEHRGAAIVPAQAPTPVYVPAVPAIQR